jgi:hypothetical protein
MSGITCATCESPLPNEHAGPCPPCGGTLANIAASIGDAISYEDSVQERRRGFANFAEAWLSDALQEPRRGVEHHARRREIMFAVCFVESYLYEFVRDHVYHGRYEVLSDYFPLDDQRGIRDRWKEVLKALFDGCLIRGVPEFCRDPSWQKFVALVRYRD